MQEINMKLYVEMTQLIERLEGALNKFKDRKEKDKQRNYMGVSNVPDDLASKEKELKSATIRTQNIKKEILKLKRKLDTGYDLTNITELENEIKEKESHLVKLED
jgi:hypothetical protein